MEDFKPGDAVLGHKIPLRERWGTWAEFVSVNEKVLVRKSEDSSKFSFNFWGRGRNSLGGEEAKLYWEGDGRTPQPYQNDATTRYFSR